MENAERQARRRIGRGALYAALMVVCTISGIERLETSDALGQWTLLAAASYRDTGHEAHAAGGEAAWALVDAYTELRRRQADVLRL